MSGRGVALAATLLAAACAPVRAADRDFDNLVRNLEAHYGKQHLHIPLFGVARFIVKIARPAGASDLKMAIFEDVDRDRHPEAGQVEALLRDSGQAWSPFIRVHSNKDGETTLIYTAHSGGKMKMLVATLERNETVLIQLRVNKKAMERWLASPARMGKCHFRRHDHACDNR